MISWDVQVLSEKGEWERVASSPSGDRAKQVAREYQIGAGKYYKFRILDPSGSPWRFGMAKLYRRGFIMCWKDFGRRFSLKSMCQNECPYQSAPTTCSLFTGDKPEWRKHKSCLDAERVNR